MEPSSFALNLQYALSVAALIAAYRYYAHPHALWSAIAATFTGAAIAVGLDLALWFEAPRVVFWNASFVLGLLPAICVMLWCGRRGAQPR